MFQPFINMALRKFIYEGKIVIYLDDISIVTGTFEEYLQILRLTISKKFTNTRIARCVFAYVYLMLMLLMVYL